MGMSEAVLGARDSPPGGDNEGPERRPAGETFREVARLKLEPAAPPPPAASRMLVGRVLRSRMLASGMMRSCGGLGVGVGVRGRGWGKGWVWGQGWGWIGVGVPVE